MSIKNYIVRPGFVYHTQDDAGRDIVHAEGETVSLPEEVGDKLHLLETVDTAVAASVPTALASEVIAEVPAVEAA
jgi:hypothetical protein